MAFLDKLLLMLIGAWIFAGYVAGVYAAKTKHEKFKNINTFEFIICLILIFLSTFPVIIYLTVFNPKKLGEF